MRGQQRRELASESKDADPVISQHLLPAEEVAKKKLIHVLSEIKIE
jgi:hypothetical protein